MTNIVTDDFTLTSDLMLQSASGNWIRHFSSGGDLYTTLDRRVRNGGSSTGLYYNTAELRSADYAVKANLAYVASSTAPTAGLCGRVSTSANTMYYALYSSANGWQLYKIVAGISTKLGSDVSQTFTSGTKEIKLVMNGTTLSLYKEGEASPIISATDSAISAAGYAGLRMSGAMSPMTGIHIDNFSVDTLDVGSTDATATTTLPSLTLSAPTATATGAQNGSATASFAAVAFSAPTATAAGTSGVVDATAIASLSSIGLIAPSAAAAATANATAFALIAPMGLVGPSATALGTASGDAVAVASLHNLSLFAPTAFATGSAVIDAIATAAIRALTLLAPTAYAWSVPPSASVAVKSDTSVVTTSCRVKSPITVKVVN